MTMTADRFNAFQTGAFRTADVEACVRHFNLSREQVYRKLMAGHHNVLDKWKENAPSTVEERVAWYATTDAHVFEGLAWHGQSSHWPLREEIARRAATFGPHEDYIPRVLDYGCGVGTEGLLALGKGAAVTFVDFPPMLEFIRTRRDCMGLGDLGQFCSQQATVSEKFPDPTVVFPADCFDVIICLDVLEHLVYPERLLNHFRSILRLGGLFIGSAPFDELQWPGHLAIHKGKRLDKMCELAGLENTWIDPIRPGRTW